MPAFMYNDRANTLVVSVALLAAFIGALLVGYHANAQSNDSRVRLTHERVAGCQTLADPSARQLCIERVVHG